MENSVQLMRKKGVGQNEVSNVKWWNRTKWTNLKTVIKIWLIHSSITVTEMRQLATLVHRPLLSPSHSFMRLFLPADHWQARSYCFHPGWRVSNQPDFLLMQNKYGSCYELLAIHSNSQTRPKDNISGKCRGAATNSQILSSSPWRSPAHKPL